MKKTTLILSLVGFSLLVLAVLGLYLLFHNLRDLESRRAAIVATAEAVLHREVRYEKATFSLRTGPVFTFSGVTISEREGTEVFARAERLICRIDAVSLLKGDLFLSDLRLVAPRLTLRRDGQGRWNVDDLLAGEDSSYTVGRIGIERGVVLLEDRFPKSGVVRATLTDLDLDLGGWPWGGKPPFHLRALVVQAEGKGNIAASGTLSLPRNNERHRGMDWDLRLRVQGIDLRIFSPYTEAWEDLQLLRGLLDGTATLRGGREIFSLSSAMSVRRMSIHCPRIFPDGFAPKQTRLEFDLERQADGFHLRR
jgi:uncharacterized protein involved in outer membrane biogenesis